MAMVGKRRADRGAVLREGRASPVATSSSSGSPELSILVMRYAAWPRRITITSPWSASRVAREGFWFSSVSVIDVMASNLALS